MFYNSNTLLIRPFAAVLVGLSEPELMVQVGSTRSLFGAVPWQLRLTEILYASHTTTLLHITALMP